MSTIFHQEKHGKFDLYKLRWHLAMEFGGVSRVVIDICGLTAKPATYVCINTLESEIVLLTE